VERRADFAIRKFKPILAGCAFVVSGSSEIVRARVKGMTAALSDDLLFGCHIFKLRFQAISSTAREESTPLQAGRVLRICGNLRRVKKMAGNEIYFPRL
jgi:hypothetical protein